MSLAQDRPKKGKLVCGRQGEFSCKLKEKWTDQKCRVVAFGRSIDVFATDARLITLTVLSGERDPVEVACKEREKHVE